MILINDGEVGEVWQSGLRPDVKVMIEALHFVIEGGTVL